MTKIKLCGLRRECDIEYVNELMPEYIGFIFSSAYRRYIPEQQALNLRKMLRSEITPVGVFVNEPQDYILNIIRKGIIGAVQLHGNEDNEYIEKLRKRTECQIIKAFCIRDISDIALAENSAADLVLLDSGTGSGKAFDHSLIKSISRPYFLAGGLTPENVRMTVNELHPYAVDASSSLETDGFKDRAKMAAFTDAVRK
ncbi:MAG: phosphoribosylanthranilate isomerase [Porcipelethomonas sp.]